MFNPTHRFPLRNADPGAGGGGGTGAPGAGQNPGTGFDPSKYVSSEDFGKTAAMIRGIQKTLETLSTSALTLDRLAEIGLVEKAEDGTVKPRGHAAPKGAAKGDPEPWKEEIAQLRRQLDEKDQALAREEKSRSVLAALTKAGAVNPDRDYVHVLDKVKKNDRGEFVVKGRDKYGAAIDVPLGEFVNDWLTQNPELKRASAAPGSGTPPGAAPGSGGGGNVVPKSTWSNPEWYKANREKILKGEISLGS
jgi:hypothetical protein